MEVNMNGGIFILLNSPTNIKEVFMGQIHQVEKFLNNKIMFVEKIISKKDKKIE